MKQTKTIQPIFLLFILYLSFCTTTRAQELKMKITVNSDKISGTDKSIFNDLQDALNQLVNGRKWTETSFATNEKIDCSLLLTITEITEENTYKGEIQAAANRPIYNTSYTSSTFNFKDTDVEFTYIQGQNLDYTDNAVDNNLTAIIAYYTYIIIGLDFNSFSLNGGKLYLEKAMNIATASQSFGGKGWTPFGSNKNRYALALSLTQESGTEFHSLWYNYHRKGLDEMVANLSRGQIEIQNTLPEIQKIYQTNPSSSLLSLFADTKLNELVGIYSKISKDEKTKAVNILKKIYPAKRTIIDQIEK